MSLPQGPHRRHNPLSDEWVLVSAERTRRPWLGRQEAPREGELPAYDPGCYLCPGNQRASGEQNPHYEQTYVFTNDYAALVPDVREQRVEDGLLVAESQAGTRRVLCFSPRHDLTLTLMAPEELRRIVDLWAAQTADLGRQYRWVQVFENRGEAMGASNPHPHGQIWAGTALPREAQREDATQLAHCEHTGRRLLLDVVGQELGGPRQVEVNTEWLALVPFWAVWPFETLVLPRRPVERLPDLDEEQRDGLAALLSRLLRRYDALFERPLPFSMGWHGAPHDSGLHDHWQLHAHLLPPLLGPTVRKHMVGYELLAEPQRDITPEEAADRLRAASPGT
jgi:UDPglucose--hexose-1-phosphate uridylyltransferase